MTERARKCGNIGGVWIPECMGGATYGKARCYCRLPDRKAERKREARFALIKAAFDLLSREQRELDQMSELTPERIDQIERDIMEKYQEVPRGGGAMSERVSDAALADGARWLDECRAGGEPHQGQWAVMEAAVRELIERRADEPEDDEPEDPYGCEHAAAAECERECAEPGCRNVLNPGDSKVGRSFCFWHR